MISFMLRILFSLIVLSFFLTFLTSCDQPRYCCEVKGADEFVIDSYKIRQGKFSILEMQGICVEPLPCDAMQEYQDTIGDDDILRITVYHPGRDDIGRAVNAVGDTVGFRVINGQVFLPELPPIFVRGLTLAQARYRLQEKYHEQIQDVEVFIDYCERLSRVVEIIGDVQVATIPIDGKLRLYDVLAMAGINPAANLFMSYVVRGCKVLHVDIYKLIKEGDMCQNIVMRPKDKIYIADPDDSKVMVMGEVGIPRVLFLPRGSMPIREALVAAGGIPFTGDKACIQIIRGEIVCPKVYQINWNHVICLPNNSLLLMPGDTVYVAEKPITQWNRFISQLFPTATGVLEAATLYDLTRRHH
jgi:polysaccharide export outer membrane protein